MSTMMGAKEADEVQTELATAMASLTRASTVVFPHAESCGFNRNAEATNVWKGIRKAIEGIEEAVNSLDT